MFASTEGHLSRAAGEVGRGSGREGVRCFNLRRDTDIRFTLSLTCGLTSPRGRGGSIAGGATQLDS